MIDNVSLSIDIDESISAPEKLDDALVISNLEFFSCRNRRDLTTYTYKAKEGNLLFTLNNQTLRINNSLHKFIAKENFSDFSLSQLKFAIEKIEKLTGMSRDKILVHTCELALNIETELPAKEYLDKFSMYKYKEFDKMRDGSIIYGIKYILTEYSIKIYDKTLQVNLQTGKIIDRNIMRFEIQYRKSRRLAGINSLADLLDKDKLKIAFNDYFKIFKTIRCVMAKDLRTLSKKEMLIYYAGQNADYWKTEIKRDAEGSKYQKKVYQSVVLKSKEADQMSIFLKLLNLKLQELLSK